MVAVVAVVALVVVAAVVSIVAVVVAAAWPGVSILHSRKLYMPAGHLGSLRSGLRWSYVGAAVS